MLINFDKCGLVIFNNFCWSINTAIRWFKESSDFKSSLNTFIDWYSFGNVDSCVGYNLCMRTTFNGGFIILDYMSWHGSIAAKIKRQNSISVYHATVIFFGIQYLSMTFHCKTLKLSFVIIRSIHEWKMKMVVDVTQ